MICRFLVDQESMSLEFPSLYVVGITVKGPEQFLRLD